MSMADQYIKTGPYKNILVVGAEIIQPYVNSDDRQTAILFGDGAGAFILTRADDTEESSICSHHLHCDGTLEHLFRCEGRRPSDTSGSDKAYIRMKGREVFKSAVRTMSAACTEALEYNNMPKDDVDWVIPHQANARIIEAIASHLDISMDKFIVEVADMGNTSAASIPLAFDRAYKRGSIKRGDTILMTAFGAGVTSGSLLMKY